MPPTPRHDSRPWEGAGARAPQPPSATVALKVATSSTRSSLAIPWPPVVSAVTSLEAGAAAGTRGEAPFRKNRLLRDRSSSLRHVGGSRELGLGPAAPEALDEQDR